MLVRVTVQERLARADADDEADQEQVDAVEREGREDDLSEDEARVVTAERQDRGAGGGSGDGHHSRVVGDANRRAMLEEVHDRRGHADDDARLPAVEDDRSRAEDEAERDAARVDPVERDRVALGQDRCRQRPGDPRQRGEVARRDRERDRGRDGDAESQQPDRQYHRREPRGSVPPGLDRGLYQPQVKLSQPQFPIAGRDHQRDENPNQPTVSPLQHFRALRWRIVRLRDDEWRFAARNPSKR